MGVFISRTCFLDDRAFSDIFGKVLVPLKLGKKVYCNSGK